MKNPTYISLFSSAGIGCYGFKMENFDCIATNELIERRINVQKCNNKCKYESGYICGDITQNETKQKLFDEIKMWNKIEKISNVDVIIATPPCQGMSVANLKKNNEINRNSLVIESIKIIKKILPKTFIFENVSAFLKTACIDTDNKVKSIEEAINYNLSDEYIIMHRVINFKDYGSNSSRTRTLVIGVRHDYEEYISPVDLFPKKRKERTLKQVIGNLKPLTMIGEISNDDIYHFFRVYPEHMRTWIHDLKEGESAFDNEDDSKKPHTIVNGKIKINVQKTGDKYKRQYWNKVAPCIHTRNDQLASQNTIHPKDDRVFSIRELMNIMTIPNKFKWVALDEKELNQKTESEKKQFLKKEEVNIRQSIGEAVPTEIFRQIACNIKNNLSRKNLSIRDIHKWIKEYNLTDNGNLSDFIDDFKASFSFTTLSKIAELSNAERNNEEAFYTNKSLLNHIYKELPTINKKEIRVLEPSVGVGNFIPYIIAKYSYADKLIIDVVDINDFSIGILKQLLKIIDIPENVTINYITADFLLYQFDEKYDVITGNPPFSKMNTNSKKLKEYRKNSINNDSANTASYFLEKATTISDNVIMIMPKFLLNTIEYKKTRDYLKTKNIVSIVDFGEKGFEGVLIETICISINMINKPNNTKIISIPYSINTIKKQSYITSENMPYWIIYRNKDYDEVFNKMNFDIFEVFRDRQITNSNTNKKKDGIWVIKSRNISDDALSIEHISEYDQYITNDKLEKLNIYQYLNDNNVYMTPNMTYKPRVCKKPVGFIVNGSVAILIPKKGIRLTKKDMLFFSSEEYRNFYKIARNYQTRSLNVDKTSVFFFGKLKEANKNEMVN
ncbi:MAG: DNA cytosine methyltransferase [Bacilli bacterium]|nr:DNA cytosine methyltransferase [Bacilli bacterium]MDD4795872.1 DNA cytosine methyltransferase [Bacilli bacterium]